MDDNDSTPPEGEAKPRRLKPKQTWQPPQWNGQVAGSFAEAPGDARARERKDRQERILAAKEKGPVIKPLPGQKKRSLHLPPPPRTPEEQAKRDEERAKQGAAKGLKKSSSFREKKLERRESGGFGKGGPDNLRLKKVHSFRTASGGGGRGGGRGPGAGGTGDAGKAGRGRGNGGLGPFGSPPGKGSAERRSDRTREATDVLSPRQLQEKNAEQTKALIDEMRNQMNQELIDLERITLGPAATLGMDEQTRAFSYFDTNGDGVVSVQELREGLDRLGLEVTQEELKVLMELYDVNSDGVLQLSEFDAMRNDTNTKVGSHLSGQAKSKMVMKKAGGGWGDTAYNVTGGSVDRDVGDAGTEEKAQILNMISLINQVQVHLPKANTQPNLMKLRDGEMRLRSRSDERDSSPMGSTAHSPQASSETAYDKPGFDAEAAEHRRDEFFQEQMGASEQLTRDMAAGMQKQPSFQEKVDLSSNHDPEAPPMANLSAPASGQLPNADRDWILHPHTPHWAAPGHAMDPQLANLHTPEGIENPTEREMETIKSIDNDIKGSMDHYSIAAAGSMDLSGSNRGDVKSSIDKHEGILIDSPICLPLTFAHFKALERILRRRKIAVVFVDCRPTLHGTERRLRGFMKMDQYVLNDHSNTLFSSIDPLSGSDTKIVVFAGRQGQYPSTAAKNRRKYHPNTRSHYTTLKDADTVDFLKGSEFKTWTTHSEMYHLGVVPPGGSASATDRGPGHDARARGGSDGTSSASGFRKVESESYPGYNYWFNPETGQTTWSDPKSGSAASVTATTTTSITTSGYTAQASQHSSGSPSATPPGATKKKQNIKDRDNSMGARRDALGGGQPTQTVAAMAEAHARKRGGQRGQNGTSALPRVIQFATGNSIDATRPERSNINLKSSADRSTSAPGNFHPSNSKIPFQHASPPSQGSFSSVQGYNPAQQHASQHQYAGMGTQL